MAPRQLYCDQMALQKKRNPSTNDRVPDFIKQGEILCDVNNKQWRLGKSIGMGAFGDIYLASDDISRHVGSDSQYVIKMEPHSSGPLFVEMNFYLRVAQEAQIAEWKSRRRLSSLGMPQMHSFGSHIYRGTRMRFIVLSRYGDSIEKMLIKHNYKLHVKTALTLAFHILNVLEYVHSEGYIHSDLKGHNMVLGGGHDHAPVYLVDFGLATRYRNHDGSHKEASPDGRKAEAGTMEFSSRDAHKGIMTRRSDLESLGYNIVSWLGGRLPWEDCLSNSELVAERKELAMCNIKVFLNESFSNKPTSVLEEYLTYISTMDYDTDPEYTYLKRLLCSGIREAGFLDDLKLTFDNHAKLNKNIAYKRKAERENLIGQKKKKRTYITGTRNPCSIHNHNVTPVRHTRNLDRGTNLRSKKFNWATILAMNPDKIIKKERCKNNDLNTPSSKSIPTTIIDDLSNPTPAMVKVMESRKRRSSETSSKRSRTDSSSSTDSSCGMTPAMKDVLASRMLYTRVLRSSSRRRKQYSE